MLFDPNFAAAALRDPARTLAGEDLSALELEWLRRPDPRAWRVDPDRPRRALGVLIKSYPASVALVWRDLRDTAPLEEFFSTTGFHDCIRLRGSMARAFGDFLIELTAAGRGRDRRLAPVAKLEQAMASLHRAAAAESPRAAAEVDRLRLSPDTCLLTVDAGTADLHEAIHETLAASGRELSHAVLDESIALPEQPLDASTQEFLLLELRRDDGPRTGYLVGASEITAELYQLLSGALQPRPRDELVLRVAELGADVEEADGVIAALVDDGVLIAAEPREEPSGTSRSHAE